MEQEGEVEASNINISDVIEVIETDPEFGSEMMDRSRRVTEGPAPSVRIIEQPASKALRFRYECEGRSAGSIPGVNSTPENKTFPTIKIDNYHGRAMVLVSCVTKDPPYRAHPHNLVGKERCKKGVCTVEVDSDTMTATFSNLGIQCVKKKDIEQALIERENLRIDPFKNGFSHKTQSGMIDLNAVRLCFQVFLEGPRPNEFKRPIHPPIVSEPIYDKKAMSDLTICKLSDCSASVAGGKEIILLCEKVAKEDINVRFYEEKDGNIVWEGWGDFTPTHVHKQVAIAFRSPRYKTLEVEYPVQAFIQLFRPSDKATSEPLHFQLTPLDAGRPTFWSLRRGNKADYKAFANILQTDLKSLPRNEKLKPAVITLESVGEETPATVANEDANNNDDKQPMVESAVIPSHWPKIDDAYTVLKKNKDSVHLEPIENKDILELTEDIKKIEEGKLNEVMGITEQMEEGFNELLNQVNDLDSICTNDITIDNECGIYTSLQMAMKNPCDFMEFQSQASGYEDVIPPRPTALKPTIPVHENPSISSPDSVSEQIKDEVLPPLPPKRAKKGPAPSKTLPPLPEGKSKFNLFSKLFSSKRNKNKSREGSICSMGSKKSLLEDTKTIENENNDVVLTEAEHYALYTSLAPHATASEFDEMSFYYSPVEGQTNNSTDVPVK